MFRHSIEHCANGTAHDSIAISADPVTVPEIQPLSVHLHGCRVRSCAMANAAHRFASTSAADLHIWDMAGAASTPLSSCSILKEGELETCVWLNNNEIAAAGSKDHTIGILDGRIGRVISRLEGHNATVNWVTCNGERLMASGSKDGSVVIWDMRAGGLCQPVHRIACSKAGVRLCKFSTPDVIGIGSYDRTWRNYSISSRSFVGTEWKHNGWIFGAAISDRLGIIATGAGNPDYSIHVWDRDTDDYLATLPGNQDHAPCLAFAPSAHNLLVNGSKDNQLVIRRISRAIS
uniref:Uncharacterized protein n=1 Tax=Spongospora subterranea TaxID=70186 RepID=A0A0H5QKN8_9EUKA|eukprot:CRZ01876.1 hypothetical protein [Spongospora subterranea]